MKRSFYFIIALVGLIIGIAAALTSVKVIIAVAAAGFLAALFLLDQQRATYILACYLILDFTLRDVLQISIISSVWDDLLLVSCFALWMFKWFVNRKDTAYHWTPLEFPIALFLGVGIFLLLAHAPDTGIGIEGLRQVIQYMLWYFVTVQLLRTTGGSKRLLYIMILIGVGVALHGLYQYIAAVEIPAKWADKLEGTVRRAFSIAKSPNILASFMILLIPVTISFVYSEKKIFKRGVFALFAVIMVLCLGATGSRSGWAAFLVAMVVYFWMKDKKMIAVLIAGAVLAYLFVPAISSRVDYLLSPEYIASSSRGGRIIRWTKGLAIWSGDIPFGVGLGQYGGAVAANRIPGSEYLDNYYLKTGVEMGLVGLSAFLLLLYNVFAWSMRTIKKLTDPFKSAIAQGLFAGMLGVIIHNFSENVFEVPWMVAYFWIFAGIIMFYGYKEKGKNSV